jgi:Tfp pilus assembly protein PilX
MQTNHERGIALILALFLMSALSVLGASLMFLSQTETFASMNYRMMSQARYAAEAGVQRTANFLVDVNQYAVPGTGVDPLANYDRTKSPVVCVAGCANADPNNPNNYVILSASSAYQSNYPVAAVRTAFAAAGTGIVHTAAGTNQDVSLTYASYATLISMQQFVAYGGTQSIVQTWEITVDGSLTLSPKATVQVVATVETPKVAANPYAAFATANSCDAIYFHGNVTTDSYDSSLGPPSGVGNSQSDDGGDIGSNGNIHVQGSVDVGGNVYTPREGVGACTAGAVDGLTGTIDGQLVKLPTDVAFPIPTLSAIPPTTAVTLDAALLATPAAACAALGQVSGPNCVVSGSTITLAGGGADLTLPTVTVASGITLQIAGAQPAQNVNINALLGNGTFEVNANTTGLNNQSVVLKVAGKNADGTEMAVPFDLSTMAWKQNAATTTYDASSLQIVYGGSANISMQGGNLQSAAAIYAPNASFTMVGTQDFYGSILAKTINNAGTAKIHYDRRLSRDFWVAGHPMMGTFSWKRS